MASALAAEPASLEVLPPPAEQSSLEAVPIHGAGMGGDGAALMSTLARECAGQIVPPVKIDYRSTGTTDGRRMLTSGEIDFALVFPPLNDDQTQSKPRAYVQFPIAVQAFTFVYNLDGGKNLTLDGETISLIYLGRVRNWSDPAIKRLNPGAALPDLTITPLFHKGGSGVTLLLTQYLSALNPEWAKDYGIGPDILGPVGKHGQTALADFRATAGAIAFVEAAKADGLGWRYATLVNAAGKKVRPTKESVQAAVESSKIPETLCADLVNPPGEASYPIQAFIYVALPSDLTDMPDAQRAQALVRFWTTSVAIAPRVASELGLVPLPDSLSKRALRRIETIRVP